MTTTPKVLIGAKFAEAAETVQYTSENGKTAIDKFTATNRSANAATLTVRLIPVGGAAAESNAVSKTIQPGQTWPFPDSLVGHNMESGDKISTLASAANAISIRASGRVFT
ncbi:hypothetical protein [Massilia varians]|uniref:hypothetical protein n=1 Tax=Massilia varians TaxID=457921 RepID=UPI0025550EFC|nr:hypothetical protein [Massilia varians]MDK6077939.1 hypothetical protein [Massilia varians]